MLDKIVIANRGEIALRIRVPVKNWASRPLRCTNRRIAILKHVLLADETVCMARLVRKKLPSISRRLSALLKSPARWRLTGYGFLSENQTSPSTPSASGFTPSSVRKLTQSA
ncbi:biotin carboxylase N-terminal domain-containing protein [Shigella flexneri]